MAADLIQRAAAICGLDNPNSDQLAAWLDAKRVPLSLDSRHQSGPFWWAAIDPSAIDQRQDEWMVCEPASGKLLDCLAAAVVEVDRIEREARN